MGFIGKITQRDQRTGVTVRAKVVTENKKKSTIKDYKVTIKPNGLSDLECCTIDIGTIKAKIAAENNLEDMKTDLSALLYSGENGTDVTYELVNNTTASGEITELKITDYLDITSGEIKQRPKYGEGDVKGYLTINVNKGTCQGVVSSRLLIVIKEYSEYEVLNELRYATNIWSKICGNNTSSYSDTSFETGGNHNVFHDLNLISSIAPTSDVNLKKYTVDPVNVTWTVKDNSISYASHIHPDALISEAGVVNKVDYTSACSLVSNSNWASIKKNGNDATLNQIRMYGVVLTAHLAIGEATQDVELKCSVLSKYITVNDLIAGAKKQFAVWAQNGSGVTKDLITTTDGESISSNNIEFMASDVTYNIMSYSDLHNKSFPELNINQGEILNTMNITHGIEMGGAPMDSSILSSIFNNGFVPDTDVTSTDNNYMKMIIDVAALNANTDVRNISVVSTISISGTPDGLTSSKETKTLKLITQLTFDFTQYVTATA